MNIYECRGSWALVTGASSGIGAEFCRQLASLGFNIVMVARRRPLLEAISDGLHATSGVSTLILEIDLAKAGSAHAVKSATDAAGVDVRLLVNNAAAGPWGSFEKVSISTVEAVVQLAAVTPIALCRSYVDSLRQFPSAGIINVSSPAALQPVPYMAVYAAAKACMNSFSLALFGEWESSGIVVQTLLPAPTKTEFDVKGGAYGSHLGDFRREPSAIVTASLSSLDKRIPLVTNSGQIRVQRAFAGLAPVTTLVRRVKKMFAPPPGR